jgi:transcriptional regulator with XRE-family HTH domain
MESPLKEKVPNVFRFRLQQALSARVGPHTGLARKQLAHAIGAHGKTLDLWMQGRGSPSAEALAELVAFFHARGDRLFKYEVFGIEPPTAPVAPAPTPVTEFATQLEHMARQMRQMVPA